MEMRINEKTIHEVLGKFIIQVTREHEPTLANLRSNAGFWLEKRISFVAALDGGVREIGIYYSNSLFTKEDYIKHFNSNTEDDRYHRLLTSEELDWLFEEFKKVNY